MFDGNLPSLGDIYFYDSALNRSIIVASTAVEEALAKVYLPASIRLSKRPPVLFPEARRTRTGAALTRRTALIQSDATAAGLEGMAVAFTFPGQGSQTVGMGKDLALAFPAARAVFDEVDEALGERLSTVIWEGPEAALTLTANAQPALMAVSLAAFRALEARGFALRGTVAFVAGHSLGEYSALAAAGMFTIADTARLLRIRGNAMQAAVPAGQGAMAAIIGLEHGLVDAACRQAAATGVVQIANDNGGGQLVISGERAAVDLAARLCTDAGAKRALMLPVSAPFHSALMAPAADAMREALARADKRKPAVPLVSNVLARPIAEPAEIVDRLVEQVTGQVRWRETVEWFAANGVTTLYEVGSGRVLSGLARRIHRDIATANIGTPAEVEGASAALR